MEEAQSTDRRRHLRTDQVDFFQHNGYLLAKAALDDDFVETLRRYTEEQVEREVGEIIWLDQDRKLPVRLSYLSERGGPYLDAIRHPAILDRLESLVGPNIEFCHNRHNHLLYKPPGDAGMGFHRDQSGWSRPIVTVLVYLDDATLENGCLEIVPGSHRRGVYPRMRVPYAPPSRLDGREGPGFDDLLQEERDLLEQRLPVLAHTGDVLFMHSCVLHGAPPNVSSTTRRSMTLGYHGSDELQPGDSSLTMLVRGERKEAKPGYRYRSMEAS